MKRIIFSLVMVATLLTGCYKDDINDLRKDLEELRKEQERQAQLLVDYETLLKAFQDRLTVTGVTETADGFEVTFSDGSTKKLAQTSIVRVVEEGGTITFYMSDGSTITMNQTETVGLWVLSEGGFGSGNGQLVYYSLDIATNRFVRDNERRFTNFGETPNDLMIYGSKMYATITGTEAGGIVRVLNPITGETIRDIVLSKESVNQQPRRLAAANGNVFVTLYSGAVAQIDTTSFTNQVIGLTGTFSEGIAVQGQSLFIANSGQGEGNTVSVVDIPTFTETRVLEVPYNPTNIVSTSTGELFLNTAAVWMGPAAGAPANVHVLNAATGQITQTLNTQVESIAAGRNFVYGAFFDWNTFGGSIKQISIANKVVSDFTSSANVSSLMFPYKVSVNPITNEVFVTQQMGQAVARYSENGTLIETLQVGQQNGAVVAFVNIVR